MIGTSDNFSYRIWPIRTKNRPRSTLLFFQSWASFELTLILRAIAQTLRKHSYTQTLILGKRHFCILNEIILAPFYRPECYYLVLPEDWRPPRLHTLCKERRLKIKKMLQQGLFATMPLRIKPRHAYPAAEEASPAAVGKLFSEQMCAFKS